MIGLIKKMFGGGKQDFFLELDESQESATPEPQTPEPEAAVEPEAEKPAETAPAPAETEAEPAPVAKKKKTKTTSKKKTASAQEPAPAQAEAPKPQPMDPAEMIAAAVRKTPAAQVQSKGEETFAPNHLMPAPTMSRRRPGPSLKMFKEMARQMPASRG